MSTTPHTHRRVRISTIVWGAMLIGAAAICYTAAVTGPLSSVAILWIVIAFGSVLVLAAIVSGILRAVRSQRAEQASLSNDMASTIELPLD
jgi:hypothetical protein